MRIAVIGSRGYPYVYSGYETFVSHLVPALAERGHEVIVYCHRGLFTERPIEVNGVRLVYSPGILTKSLSQLTHSLCATVDVLFRDVDVVFYVNSANGPFGLLLKAFAKASVINVDGLEWLRPKWKGLGRSYFRWASKLAARHFTEIVTDADAMARVYESEFGRPSVTIAYGGTPAESKRPERITELGLEPRGYYLVVGRLIPDNNADIIAAAYARTAIERKLVIVGDVPYQDEFADRIRGIEDTRIVLPGYIRDQELLRELWLNCYAYVHGHEFGGTNPTLLQALASGACVLALDTPFTREVLAGPKHGIYFAKSVQAAAEALVRVDQDRGLVEGKRAIARQRILDAYTWESIVDKYERLFLSLAGS